MQTLDDLGGKLDQNKAKLDSVDTKLSTANGKLDTLTSKAEKRIPITQAMIPLTITVKGSYYLTQNLTVTQGDGINVGNGSPLVGGVTIDLNGFTISAGSANARDAIAVNTGATTVTILNGHITGGIRLTNGSFSGTGFRFGIQNPGGSDLRIRDVTVTGCEAGITQANTVEHCAVSHISGNSGNAVNGFVVSDTTAENFGVAGIVGGTVQNCHANTPVGAGEAIRGETVLNSVGIGYVGNGISATVASNCRGDSTNGFGLSAPGGSATNCMGTTKSGQYGLLAETASFCQGTANGHGTGLFATIAIGCTGHAGAGGTGVVATHRYLMP